MGEADAFAFALIGIDVIMIGLPLVWMAYAIITEIRHRRRMRELDELAARNDFWGVIEWGKKHLKR